MNAIHIVVAVFLNSLWIDALLALAVWALLRSVRVNASTRYFGWLVTLIAAIVLPVLTTIPQISYAHRTAQPVMSAVQTSAVYHRAAVTHAARTLHSAKAQPPSAQQRAAQPPPSGAAPTTAAPSIRLPGRLHFTMPVWLAQGLFVLWALFALFIGVRLAWDLYRLERLKREAMPLPFELRDQMERWVEAAYGAARPVRICVSDKIEVPVAVGLFDSMILLPAHLLEQLSAGEIDRISLHELAHLRRADDWTNSVQRIAQIVFFFNPAIKFIGSQLDLEREVACDDWVLALTGEIRPYATCLHKMAELTAWPHQALAAPGVFATRKGISVRIERLLNRHRNARVNVGYLVPTGVIAALVALFVFANVVTPVIAYTPEGAIITKPPAVSQVLAHAKKLVAHVPIVAWPIIRTVQPAPRASVRTVVHTEYKTRTVYLRNVNKTSNGHAVNTPPRLRALPAVRLPPNVAAVAQVPPVDVNVPPTHVYVPPTHVHVPAVHPYVGPINVNVPEVKVDVPAIHVHVPSVRRCACAADEQVARGNGPSCSGCDLENVDWSGRDLSARNFTGSNFSHARLASANFSRANLSG
ncbi:MAG: pentapeptide repeat-containing protein, partial [Candidatus Eremiobacteraeota bacterium]|nr:pentapeptide repeat-containing protein [Candidatus Eremiobacteraeota bacterium]